MARPALAWVLALVALAGACSSPGAPLAISLSTDTDRPAHVVISGLSSAEASGLRAASLDETAWKRLLKVSTDAEGALPVAGTYAVVGTTIEFTPAFPLDAGRSYSVRFDPVHMPEPRSGPPVITTVGLPARDPGSRVSVAGIYPSGGEWPENLLRFYVHFSGAMARETGVGRVYIVDDTGEEVADALVPATIELWSPDQTRYTVLFEPGRVKRGIQPNLDMGRALVAGRTYTVVVDGAWRDTAGRPLTQPFRHVFRAGPARESALSLKDWRVSTPAAGSRDPLVVTVPASLDHALFARTVGVMSDSKPLDGVVEVAKLDTEWRFTPAEPWRRSSYELAILSALEDPSGNRIGRAFEVLPTDPAANAEAPERFTLPVTIR